MNFLILTALKSEAKPIISYFDLNKDPKTHIYSNKKIFLLITGVGEKNVINKLKNQKDKRANRFVLSKSSYQTLSNSIPKEDLAITISKISMSYADKLWMFNVRDPNKVRKTLLNLARSAVSLNENNDLCQFSFGLAY